MVFYYLFFRQRFQDVYNVNTCLKTKVFSHFADIELNILVVF